MGENTKTSGEGGLVGSAWTCRADSSDRVRGIVLQLRRRRLGLSLSQMEIAVRTGIARSSIAHIESCGKGLTCRTTGTLAVGLGMELALVPMDQAYQYTAPHLLTSEGLRVEEERLLNLHNAMVYCLEGGLVPPAAPDDTVVDRLDEVRAEILSRVCSVELEAAE